MGTLAAVTAAGAAGFLAGRHEPPFTLPSWATPFAAAAPAPVSRNPVGAGPIVYYRDPDHPAYSSAPGKTTDGRDFIAVYASEDVHFEDIEDAAAGAAAPPENAVPSTSERKIKFYRNPMGLPDTSLVPKKDSMGMDYIPVFTGDDEDGSTIKLSPGKLQRTGVRSEPVAMRTITTPVRAAGTIQLDERRVSVIALRFDAYVDHVANVTTGSVVRQGQPLMQVYGPDLLIPAAQFISAVNDRADGPTLRSARRRLENYDVPESVIAQIEHDREVPPTIAWPAPRAGIVVERSVVDGMKAAAGQALFRLADISVVWALVDIPESDLPAIAIGQSVIVKPRGVGRSFTGRVGLVYPAINRETRTARIRVELSNPGGVLLPDMYAQVEIATGGGKPVLAVPGSAVINGGEHQTVILDKGEGRLEPRDVKLGRRGDGFVEVASGLADGDQVVTGANFLIDAESNLKAALKGLTAPGEAK